MANLYEINKELLECIDFETGEIIDIKKFDALQIDRNDKLENVALWYKNLLSEAQAFRAEKDVFAEKQKRAESKAESLKNYLDSALNGSKFETVKVNISYRKSTSVDVLDIDSLPEQYRKEVTTVSADKIEIAKALKVGEVVTGAELVENQNIQIK
jgi:uncharacterized protein with FMN-binding domain